MTSTPLDHVKFNVGGTIFETSWSTLEKLASARLFAVINQQNSQHDQSGAFFIDRDPEYFRVILNIARYGAISMHGSKLSWEVLEKEAEYYLLDEHWRSLITSCKTQMPIEKSGSSESIQRPSTVVMSNGDVGPGLGIRLDITIAEFTSAKGDFLYHHACLKKKGGILTYLSGEGCSLTCTVNSKCREVSCDDRVTVECCRCLREIGVNAVTSELRGWCHRCHRCLRCAETFCMPIKM